MASMINEIIIRNELRPCIVANRKALFHQWIEKTDMIGHKFIAGIVEFEDGTVNEFHCNKIKFLDNKLQEYCFDEEEEFDIKDIIPN